MLNYKMGADMVVPVVLVNSTTGVPHTSVAYGSVTVTIIKTGGTTATYTPTISQWTECANAYAGSGYYNLTIPSTYADTLGVFQYGVAVTGDVVYFGVIDVVLGDSAVISNIWAAAS